VFDADIVFDTLGKDYTTEAFEIIKQGGKVVSVVGPLDEASAKMFGMNDYTLPENIAALSKSKNADYKFIFMHPNGVHLNTIKTLVEDEKIKPIVDKVYPFNESIEAFEHLASGRAQGKIIVKLN
jgi:NADPH:quinone reductase-like Zn-dependent oxidoreductase